MNRWILAGSMAVVGSMVWAQAPAPAEAPWQTTAAAGANVTRGNSETMTLNGSVISVFKQDKNEARVGIEANYGETEVVQGSGTNETRRTETNINNARAFAEYRRLLSDRVYAYGKGEVLEDDVADIDYRAMVGPGLGRYFVSSDRQKLSAEGGVTYIQTKQGGETDDTTALRLAERYDVKVSDTSKIWESVEYLPSLEDFSRGLLNAEVGAEAAMSAKLNLRVVIQDKYNSDPAPGKKENDLAVIAGVSCKL